MRVLSSKSGRCLPFSLLCFALRSLAQLSDDTCRSNQTHIAWLLSEEMSSSSTSSTSMSTSRSTESRTTYQRKLKGETLSCTWQNTTEASQEAYRFLREHVMSFDRPFLETLGFHDGAVDTHLPDGLADGMIGQTIHYALRAKVELPYTDSLPKEVWQEYVLNYANTNEARSNWRPLFWEKLRPLVTDGMNISSVASVVNANMWKILSPAGSESIVFKSGSTPLIFDPMSILAWGYASCTGVSILLVNTLRTLGVPARIAGTVAWYQDPAKGNHNWVEVWMDGHWYFLEPSPGQASVDCLELPPCQRWFCHKSRFGSNPVNTTLVYAARLDGRSSVCYPLAWEAGNFGVPGEDVSHYYRNACGEC